MADIVSVVTQRGLFENVKNAIIGAIFGVGLFFGSFALLFWNEGRTNKADVAKTSVVAAAEKADPALDAKFVSVTGTIQTTNEVSDSDFLKPGPWVTLSRNAQTYAWHESEKTESHSKVGGGTEEVTTYTYQKKWVSTVPDSTRFHEKTDHENPPQRWKDATFAADDATIGAWGFSPKDAEVDADQAVELKPELLLGNAVSAGTNALAMAPRIERDQQRAYVYVGGGSLASPQLGDARLSYTACPKGATMTLFGLVKGAKLVPYAYEEGASMLRALSGTREQAIHRLQVEDAILRWILRAVGFFCMWFGMTLVLHPLEAIANILPFAGQVTHFAIGCLTFPIALGLSTVTVIVSMILHSLVATLVVVGVLFAGVLVVFKLTRAKKVAAAAAGGPQA